MPGRLRTSFRFGNLSEHLGLLLLKGIAAVADVPRPEDVGLDAIATLLRRDEDGNCYAEDSFLVQLKSESVTSIDYEGHELEWLVGQTQPMFIGLVSLADARISLYSTIFVNHAVLALHAKKVTIRFGVSEIPGFLRGQKWLPWTMAGADTATVWLGVPVLQWALSDLANKSWSTRTYRTLKRFISVAQRERELLSFGQTSVLDWSTNNPGSIVSRSGFQKGSPDDFGALAERCAPGLNSLMLQAWSMRNDAGESLMLALINLAAALRNCGVVNDPHHIFGKSFVPIKAESIEGPVSAPSGAESL